MTGTLYGVGMGPGDPDYLTVTAHAGPGCARRCWSISASSGRRGNARTIADAVLPPTPPARSPSPIPTPPRLHPEHPDYVAALAAFYDDAAGQLADHLGAGRDVAILSEGDPFFYGSFMHLWRRLKDRFPVEVVPGVTGMSGCWTRAGTPITWGDDVLTVLPATLPADALTERLRRHRRRRDHEARAPPAEGARRAARGRAARAGRLCRARHHGRRARRAARRQGRTTMAPYFSMVLVPGEGRRP